MPRIIINPLRLTSLTDPKISTVALGETFYVENGTTTDQYFKRASDGVIVKLTNAIASATQVGGIKVPASGAIAVNATTGEMTLKPASNTTVGGIKATTTGVVKVDGTTGVVSIDAPLLSQLGVTDVYTKTQTISMMRDGILDENQQIYSVTKASLAALILTQSGPRFDFLEQDKFVVNGRADRFYPVIIANDMAGSSQANMPVQTISIGRGLSDEPKPIAGNGQENYNGAHWLDFAFDIKLSYSGWDGSVADDYRVMRNVSNYRAGIAASMIMSPNHAGTIVLWLRGGGTGYTIKTNGVRPTVQVLDTTDNWQRPVWLAAIDSRGNAPNRFGQTPAEVELWTGGTVIIPHWDLNAIAGQFAADQGTGWIVSNITRTAPGADVILGYLNGNGTYTYVTKKAISTLYVYPTTGITGQLTYAHVSYVKSIGMNEIVACGKGLGLLSTTGEALFGNSRAWFPFTYQFAAEDGPFNGYYNVTAAEQTYVNTLNTFQAISYVANVASVGPALHTSCEYINTYAPGKEWLRFMKVFYQGSNGMGTPMPAVGVTTPARPWGRDLSHNTLLPYLNTSTIVV